MKIAVTGSGGFLGGHVARHLSASGHEVVPIDLLGPKPVDFTKATPKDFDGCQVICHLGAIGDVYACANDPAEAFRINVGGTANVAYCAREAGARLVYASTWEVYDKPSGASPWSGHTEHADCAPHHPYNLSKLMGERAARDAGFLTALRLGTAYGPGMRGNSVFRRFIDLGRKGEPITIHGDGSQGRQFVHATDVARAFEMASLRIIGLYDPWPEAFNIVGDEMTSIASMADAVSLKFGIPVHRGEPRPGDVKSAWVSNAAAETVLGWRPLVSFADGFRALMED